MLIWAANQHTALIRRQARPHKKDCYRPGSYVELVHVKILHVVHQIGFSFTTVENIP